MEDAGESLTKAKLYASMSDDDSWTEMGVGVVSVVLHSSAALDDVGGGAEGAVGHLDIVDIDNPAELLMSTPITLADAYVVHSETILWWTDPQLGRCMACSFNTKEGCEKIYGEIVAYQRSRKSALSREMNGAEAVGALSICSHWAVCRENLPAILSAVTTNAQRFGMYVRGCDAYFKELAELFQACRRDGDVRGMDLAGQITLALLRSPFNTDGKIIAQFVENSLVDMCVDIVQYAIGRRERSTGFVSFEERRATFRNPLQLPESLLARIHVLYSCGYLKDLLPLSLDEADAVPSSLLSTYLASTKLRLVEEICRSPVFIPRAFKRAVGDVEDAFEVLAFIHDMSKTIKNTMMALNLRASLFEALVEAGLLPFLRFVLENAIRAYAATPQPQPTPSAPPHPPRTTPGMAMQMACDIVCSCIMLYPSGRGALVAEASASPDGCLLELLLQCMVTSQRGTELQAAVDAVVSCGIGMLQYVPDLMEMGGATKSDVVRFWVEGALGRRPPLLPLAACVATTLASGESIARGSHEEARVLHAFKVLTAITDDISEALSAAFANVLVRADLPAGLDAALRSKVRSSANVQSSVVAFVAAVLNSGKQRIVEKLLGDGTLLDTAARRYMACAWRSNVLSASLAHLLDSVCRSIHREKSERARGVPQPAGSPFLHLLHSEDEEEEPPDSCGNGAADEDELRQRQRDGAGKGAGLCQSLGTRLWAAHGEALRARSPALALRLEHALQETPEEARSADAETSSVASTLERSMRGISELEFDAMAVEFGVEVLPPRPLAPGGGSSGTPRLKSGREAEIEEAEEAEAEEATEPPLKRSRSESPSSPSSPSVGR
ncbi:uncharacterized protein Tco025E_00414 [Trypanosoma conorhini]|uniref:Serine/threonine-protein phosphatase 4 regulatory subunit 3-like central domain-containing protein n=1 Tax=Trypanosoma conorhini TaxID=83891 RepID=A0A422QBK2_9TRYP|nr:uncharacterized protein Tco025E_00414 [Trypanosoma conorhini]RNF27344.1 hypothetical protein Tco025E_00414 [Trypanosoma conorhini]